MQDTIEVKLPSGKVAVIRNYVTRADLKKASELLYMGVVAAKSFGNDTDGSVDFPMSNIMASEESYVPRLVQSLGGESTNLSILIDELRADDYEVLSEKVTEIVEQYSPKAKAAKKN